jgi:hypothetical protein
MLYRLKSLEDSSSFSRARESWKYGAAIYEMPSSERPAAKGHFAKEVVLTRRIKRRLFVQVILSELVPEHSWQGVSRALPERLLHSKALDDATFFAFGISFFDRHAFISDILTTTQSNLYFHHIEVAKVGFERNYSHALLFGLLQEFPCLLLVHEQYPWSLFFVLKVSARHAVLSNVDVV